MSFDTRFHISCLASATIALMVAANVRAKQEVRADRSPLTFRDAGVYCNVSMTHGTDEGLGNMLPAKRAVIPQAPWSFYIMKCNYNSAEKDPDSLHPHVISTLRQMAANGKKVILRPMSDDWTRTRTSTRWNSGS